MKRQKTKHQKNYQPEWQSVRDGSLIQIAPDGTRTTVLSGNGLESATALSVGLDGAIYVSNRGDSPGQGQVLRIDIKKTVSISTPSNNRC